VLAVACHHPVRFGGATCRVDELLTKVPARAWQCVSAGKGAKGQRLYDWAFVRLDDAAPPPGDQAGRRWLMVRRNRATGELASYRCGLDQHQVRRWRSGTAGPRWRCSPMPSWSWPLSWSTPATHHHPS
jgi:hypothetical protein